MRLFAKVAAEALGTFLLLFTIGAANGDPFAVGGAIWLSMIYTTFISGALFNPAVTLSCLIRQHLMKTLTRQTIKEFAIYTPIQFIFGFLGAYLSWRLTHNTFYYDFTSNFPAYKPFLCELIYTFILCFNAHYVGKTKHGLYLEGLLVVITVVTGALTIGHISKNCLNPVVGFSMDIVYYIAHGEHVDHLWVYLTSPLLGGVLAAFAHTAYNKIDTQGKLEKSSLIMNISVSLQEIH